MSARYVYRFTERQLARRDWLTFRDAWLLGLLTAAGFLFGAWALSH